MPRSPRKVRTPIADEVAARVLYACDRACCVCQEYGRALQLHHIDEDPSNGSEDNLVALCLQHHHETQVRGGFGRILDATQVRTFRTEWVARVAERRARADKLILEAEGRSDVGLEARNSEAPFRLPMALLKCLPALRRAAVKQAGPLWSSPVTADQLRGGYEYVNVLQGIISALMNYYPAHHFGAAGTRSFVAEYTAGLFVWHRAILEPLGAGPGGTMTGPMACAGVWTALSEMVVQLVRGMTIHEPEFDFESWRTSWRDAEKEVAPC